MLRGISEIRAFFRTNETPIYFISPTAFNLLGIDRWLRNFFYVNYFDSFEGNHPRVFVPKERPYREFESMEDVCNYLLEHKEVIDRINDRGGGGKAVFVMFDDETEEAAAAAGLEIAHPSAELRHRLDSKIVTTRLGNEAGVPSAPNTLGRATSYEELMALAESAALGEDLVVQTPYGDSGKTTFFISSKDDWDRYADDMADQELKVMKRINNRAAAVEAVLTRHGTVVGPLMTDLTGHPELTPHKGGWCGNDIFPEALSPEHRERARVLTRKLGDRLAVEGYRGFLEIDYLADVDSGELYLGEINPRISGVTSMTNVTAGAYADMPLFLFHMLEYMDVDYEIDVEDINRRWAAASSVDVWSQIILKDTGDEVEQLTQAPKTGIWRLEDGGIQFARWGHDWHSLHDETEAFFLRVLAPGDFRYPGADLGVLVARSRMQTEDNQLTERAREWIAGVQAQFAGTQPAAAGAGAGRRATRSRQRDGPAPRLEALERLLPHHVRPAVAHAPAAGLVRRRVDRPEAALVRGAVQRRFEERVLEPLAVELRVAEQVEHALLALLAADRLRVLRPLDLALVVGGGGEVDEPGGTARADVGGHVGAGAVEQREVLRRVHRDPRQRLARRRHVVAGLEHVADDQRDREPVADVRAPAEGERDRQPAVVHPVEQPPQAVAHPDHAPLAPLRQAHDALEPVGRVVVVAHEQRLAARPRALRAADDEPGRAPERQQPGGEVAAPGEVDEPIVGRHQLRHVVGERAAAGRVPRAAPPRPPGGTRCGTSATWPRSARASRRRAAAPRRPRTRAAQCGTPAPGAAAAGPRAASSSGRWRLPPRAAATSPSRA